MEQKILYYDCFSGISGDLNLGAMIDIGVDPIYLVTELKKLRLEGWELNIYKDSRKGIYGTRVEVISQVHHHHRNYQDIKEIIENAALSDKIIKDSLNIFLNIANAEAKVHNKTLNEIHFHEIGAVDSIIDIVGAAICIDFLKIDKIISSTIELGAGFVECAHGKLPVPAPATIALLKGIPIKSGIVQFETTTPTGAALLSTLANEFNDNLDFNINKIGYGIGSRDAEIPNVLRVYLATKNKDVNFSDDNENIMLECNIDDMNPEMYDFIIERLLSKGAVDVFLTPIIMKKSRPATKLNIICSLINSESLKSEIFENTTTLGIREYSFNKTILTREYFSVSTKYGNIKIKNAFYKGKKVGSKPEYDDCKRLANLHGVNIKEIYDAIEIKE